MADELDIDLNEVGGRVLDAIDSASDQGKTTYLRGANGKRIAAIVPVDVAEEHDQQIAEILATPLAKSRSEGLWVPALTCQLEGPAQHEANGIILRPTPETHAHWRGKADAGHEAYMNLIIEQRREADLEVAARTGLPAGWRRNAT
jgi:hypothetical protein